MARTGPAPEPGRRPEPVTGGRGGDGAPSFEEAVDAVLRGLGPGDLVTYGEVAAEAGFPGAARAVGRVLATSDGAHPWWRVVNAAGRLVPGHEAEHARRLAAEGIETVDGRVRGLRSVRSSRPSPTPAPERPPR
jgi:methylated-DNA-protein-cysteine methyltransferase-like protein